MGANNSIPANYEAPALGILSVDIILTTLSLLGRISSRRIMKVKPAADDYLSYVAFVANLGLLISGLMMTHYGALSLDKVSHEDEEQKGFVREAYNALAILYVIAITLVKLSILFLYRRTFTMLTSWFRYAWWVILTLVVLWTITCFILLALQATDTLPKGGFSRLGISITGAFNAVSDILMLGLPAFIISRMKLQKKQKIALISIFLVGGIGTAVSIIRATIFLINRDHPLNDAYSNYLDVVLTATESSAGLMCACLPLMKPIIVRIMKRIWSWRGMESGPHGWSTLGDSSGATVHAKTERNNRTATADENGWDIQLLPQQKPLGKVKASHAHDWGNA